MTATLSVFSSSLIFFNAYNFHKFFPYMAEVCPDGERGAGGSSALAGGFGLWDTRQNSGRKEWNSFAHHSWRNPDVQSPVCTNDDPDAPRVTPLISSVSFLLTAGFREQQDNGWLWTGNIRHNNKNIKPPFLRFLQYRNVSKLRLVFQVIVMFSSLSANVLHVLF